MSFLSSKFKRVSYAGLLYGTIAGLIASWSISTAIAIAEVVLGLKISTFYSILGLSSGLTDNYVSAAYLGFGLHIITGTILGAVVGYIITRLKESIILKRYKGTLIGMAGWYCNMVGFIFADNCIINSAIYQLYSHRTCSGFTQADLI